MSPELTTYQLEPAFFFEQSLRANANRLWFAGAMFVAGVAMMIVGWPAGFFVAGLAVVMGIVQFKRRGEIRGVVLTPTRVVTKLPDGGELPWRDVGSADVRDWPPIGTLRIERVAILERDSGREALRYSSKAFDAPQAIADAINHYVEHPQERETIGTPEGLEHLL